MTGRKVDFLLVGFPKSGSTTIYHLLKSHPEIVVPGVKEINYFNSDYNREMEKHMGANHFQLASSEEEYLKFFHGPADKILCDVNPGYIFSQEAPQNIFKHNPAAKILISVREPISFLRSFHYQLLYNMVENEPDFLRALSLEESRRAGRNIPQDCHNPFDLYYSFLVEYKKHIKRFTDVFGYDSVKIVLFDDITENEEMVYQAILRFLNVKIIDFIPSKRNQNRSHALRFAWLRSIVFRPPIKKWLYTNTPQNLMPLGAKISQMVFKREQEKPFVSHEEITRLKKRFEPNVNELNLFLNKTGLVDRDIASLWGY